MRLKRSKKKAGKKALDGDKRLVRLILAAAVIINFMLLIPLLDGLCLVSGDGTAHYAAAQAASFRLDAGGGLFGNWNQLWATGFPAYQYYQYLGHFLLVFMNLLFFKFVPLLVLQKILVILAVAFFPLSMYYGTRKLGLAPLSAAFAALFSFTVSSSVGHGGLGFSLVYHGLFTQLLAVFLFPIVLARIYVTISEKRSYFLSILLVSLVLLMHPIVGYVLCISCLIFLFERAARASLSAFIKRLVRFVFVFVLISVVVSHFFVPFLLGGGYYGGSSWMTDTTNYYQSSMPEVLFDFFTGKTLDFYRFPFILLTAFFLIGLYAIFRRRDWSFTSYFALTGLVLFLLISFGRSFWGVLFDVVPGLKYMLVFRMVFALQFFALFFVGMGFSFLFSALRRRVGGRVRLSPRVLLCIFLFVLSLPLFVQMFMTGQQLCRMTNSDFDENSFSRLVVFLRNAPDGRFIARPELGFSQPYFESLLPIYTSHDSFSTSSIGSVDNLAFYYTQFFMLPSPDAYDLYNVKYALVPSDRETPYSFFKQEFVAGNYSLYSIPTTGFFDLVDSTTAVVYDDAMNSGFVRTVNRAWLSTRAMANNDFPMMFHRSQRFEGNFDWIIHEHNNSLTELELAKRFNRPREKRAPCGRITYENRSLDHYIVSVTTNRSCLVLLKASYHPGWRAVRNGVDTFVVPVSPSFMAVPVESGISSVEFYYEEDISLKHWLLVFGVVVLLGVLLYDIGSAGNLKKKAKKVTSLQK